MSKECRASAIPFTDRDRACSQELDYSRLPYELLNVVQRLNTETSDLALSMAYTREAKDIVFWLHIFTREGPHRQDARASRFA